MLYHFINLGFFGIGNSDVGEVAPCWYPSFKGADKKRKTFRFTVFPLKDMSNFRDMEIVDILSGSVNSNLVVNLKTPDRWRVKRSNTNNTNITQTSTSFNKFRPSEKSKTDSKITESQNSIIKYLVQYSQVIQNPKKSKRNCFFYYSVCYFFDRYYSRLSHSNRAVLSFSCMLFGL